MVSLFASDDASFFKWLAQNPDGYVVNMRRNPTSNYLVLHRAHCRTLKNAAVADGGYTGRGYVKLCGESKVELLDRLRRDLSNASIAFSKECAFCCR